MSDIDPAKLKVVELRAELSARGLDTKGNKPVLIERLREALENEQKEEEVEESEEEEAAEEEESSDNQAEESATAEPATAQPAPQEPAAVPPVEEVSRSGEPTPGADEAAEPEPAREEPKHVEPEPVAAEPVAAALERPKPVKEEPKPIEVKPDPIKEEPKTAEKELTSANVEKPEPVKVELSPVKEKPILAKENSPKQATSPPPQKTEVKKEETDEKELLNEEKDSASVVKEPTAAVEEPKTPVTKLPEVKEEKGKTEDKSEPMDEDVEMANNGTATKVEDKSSTESTKPKYAPKLKQIDPTLLPKKGEKYEVMELTEWEEKPRMEGGSVFTPKEFVTGRKRNRSASPESEDNSKKVEEDEPDIDESAVLLSWYDSDLNLVIDKKNFLSASPMTEDGFAFIWAGVRASHGVKEGKVFYELLIEENLNVSHLQNEEYPHVVRLGWSIPSASMQLGEETLSFGYGGTGKVSCNNKFRDYGKCFQEGDKVGAFLDMTGDMIRMSFSVNGADQEVAFEVPRDKLNKQPLFPHILTKNCRFTVNFGSSEPWFPPPDSSYTQVAKAGSETVVKGPKRLAAKADCEIIMMCGLPGCGKTTWCNKYAAKYPERMYNIMGTNNLIDKMRVMGLSRRRNYAGRWEELISKCTECLNKLLVVASGRRRNYILDQTNVYPSAQRRKMRAFEGYVRRAVVIVPTDEEYKQRVAKRESEEGKDVPDTAVLEMKGNFQLPSKGEIFTDVRYEELDETEARKLVQTYNQEGQAAGYGSSGSYNKRQRTDNYDSGKKYDNNRYGGGDNRQRGGWGNRDGGGGGWRDNNSGGGYRGRGGGGGWRGGRDGRDRGGGDGRSYGRNASDYGSGGGGGYNRERSGDRHGGKDRYGGSGGGGNWSGQSSGGNYGGYGQQGWKSGGYGQQQGGYGSHGGSYGGSQSQSGYGGSSSHGGYQQSQSYYGQGQQSYGAGGWGQQGGYGGSGYQGSSSQPSSGHHSSYGQYGYQQGSYGSSGGGGSSGNK